MNTARLLSLPFLIILCTLAFANHGPGASGGGSATLSGETLKPGKWDLELREDYTKFDKFSQAQVIANAQQTGDFDSLDHGYLTSVSLSYGVIENLQLSASL